MSAPTTAWEAESDGWGDDTADDELRREARDERAAASQLRPRSADVLNVSTQSRARAVAAAGPTTEAA